MRLALVNPAWTFDGSIYFGCREPHLPLEYGYAKSLLTAAGHEAEIVDAQLGGFDISETKRRVEAFRPDALVVTTAPSYLFWRCAPPELTVPRRTLDAVRGVADKVIVVGPHASTTPRSTLEKLGGDVAILGECEDVICKLADTPQADWPSVPSTFHVRHGAAADKNRTNATDLTRLPALTWSPADIARHGHHHHRFDREPDAPGAEIEASRGCPYHCTFCAKDNFRDDLRRRPLPIVLAELDGLIAQGVRYVYFIDEIFLPNRDLLRALATRDIEFGVQMRIDNWSHEMLDLLASAGCVSIEAGLESVTPQGRSLLAKRCKATTEEMAELLVHAKRSIPFVQANLLDSRSDDPKEIAYWRTYLKEKGVWANDPVPLFPYPGSPEYTLKWGEPDDRAWERAHEHYLLQFDRMSDIQDNRPLSLGELERFG